MSKPGRSFCRFRKLRTKSDAPTSRMQRHGHFDHDERHWRNRAPRPLCPDPRAPSRSTSCRSRRPACSTGARPKTRPVSADSDDRVGDAAAADLPVQVGRHLVRQVRPDRAATRQDRQSPDRTAPRRGRARRTRVSNCVTSARVRRRARRGRRIRAGGPMIAPASGSPHWRTPRAARAWPRPSWSPA